MKSDAIESRSSQTSGAGLRPHQWSNGAAYAAAVGFVILAALGRWLLDPLLDDRLPFITFFVAVLATAYVGNFRHTVVAAVLGFCVAYYCFVPERFSLRVPEPADIAGLVLYVVVTGAIAAFSGSLRAAQADAHGRIAALTAAQTANRRFAAIVESSDDAIIGKDLAGIVMSWNRGAERIFGYAADEMIGQPIQRLMTDDRIDEEPPILRRLARGERIDHYETIRKRKDGRLIEVSLTISPIHDASGRVIGASKIARDISERNQAAVVSRRLAAIVESSDDAIVAKDLKGTVTNWNRGAERIFGYSAQEMIGKPISILMPADRINEEPSILERISGGEHVEHYETKRQRKDGTIIDVSLTISPIRDASGRVVGASKIARDITDRARVHAERRHLLESERAARMEAERATRLRDDFLAVVSHELRTPLNGILGWAQLLKRGANDSIALKQGIDAIEQGARAQAQLIDDLLDMNRIMAGKLHLDIQNVHLASLIESALETLRPAADAKGIRLQSALATNVASIRGDPARLQQVFWNLLSNAVKFTPKGGKVQVLLERVNSHIEISVADTGVGIKPDFLPHVFERFRQADASTARRYGGLGLGLAIVKQIVELHGGTVAVESLGEGEGTTFHVRIPVSIIRRPPGAEPEFVGPVQEERASLGGIRVLVVDDDPGAAEIVKRMLAAYGADATTAASGDEALIKIPDSAPDIILSDIGMPEMDGYEFISALRKGGNKVPVIAVTAFARAEDRIRTLQAGYGMHLAKPIDARELLTVVRAMLRNTGRL